MVQMQTSVTSHGFYSGAFPVEVSISQFKGESGAGEYHLMVRPTNYGSITDQMEWVSRAYQDALDSVGLGHGTCVFRRFFCSDLVNQASVLKSYPFANLDGLDEPCAVSLVCQPPSAPAKVVLWAYHVSDPDGVVDKRLKDGMFLWRRGDLIHIWATGLTCKDRDMTYDQTEGIFLAYEDLLKSQGACLRDDAIRTWFFVRDIDAEYQGLVKARRDIFAERGLTPDTHFIASTGISGSSADSSAKVMMDAYTISGVGADQIRFLSAPQYLSPTHVYGVTFERGVSVAYRDRKHILISGTASIDHAGRIVHQGDVLRQLDRTLENIEALLEDAGAAFGDVCSFIAYVRDPSDIDAVQQVMWERFGSTPCIIVTANVCRPGWLVEVECQAIVPANNPMLPAF